MSDLERQTSDRLAIRELIDRYNDIVNHREWTKISSIFAPDAVWEAKEPINLVWTGLADIEKKLPDSVGRMEVLIQTTSGIVIELDSPTQARARSLLSEMGRNQESQEGMHSVGSYADTIVKIGGVWKFARRTLTLIYNDQLPVPGGTKNYKY